MSSSSHISVLSEEVLEGLNINPADVVVDATVNGGGHASLVSKELSDTGVFIGIDLDKTALELSEKRLKDASCQVHLIHDNFLNLSDILASLGLEGFDKILFDLGWSSNQFENPERGFSFHIDGPLLMTLADDTSSVNFTAYDIVNTWSQEHLIDILEGYGEEKYAYRIAKAIVEYREKEALLSTLQLAELIYQSVPKKYQQGKIHPATKTFQALRIAVNNEMEVLKKALERSFDLMNPRGRMLVISFHSIEDRIVKHFFKKCKESGEAVLLTKKPITAQKEELLENRRSRSAKLRIIQKI